MGTAADQKETPRERLAALARLLIQLRFLLTGVALLLLPPQQISAGVALALISYAVLSWLLSRYWGRFSAHVVRYPVLTVADILVSSAILAMSGLSGAFFLATVLTSATAGVLYGVRGVAGISALQILGYLAALFTYLGGLSTPTVTLWVTVQAIVIQPLLYPTAGYIGLRLRGLLEELAAEQERRGAA